MAKKCQLLLLSFLLLILGGCAESSGASAGKIIPPSKPVSPLVGKWTVLQELDTNSNGEEATQQWVGSDVQFAAGAVSFGGHVWEQLSYKIKRVKADDYLLTKYIPPAGISAQKTQEVDVLTVYAAANYLGEFMKLDDKNMIFFVQNEVLLLKKVSDQAESTLGAANTNAQDLNKDSNEGTSGVLLGLRMQEGDGYTYQTLWIAADHHQLHPVLASEQPFFPRTSGFWELSVQDLPTAGKTGNLLSARNVAAKISDMKKAEDGTDDQVYTDPAERIINYIGNDYVAIEKKIGSVNQLQVLPVDKLSSPAEIKVSDLLGDNGFNAYLSVREQTVAGLRDKGITSIVRDESGENFGLARKNGHWSLVGRINYQNGGMFEQTDFDLKIIPPTNLVFYDTLVLSWHNIKDRVPDAMDAFTSPNRDIALVKTKNKLTIYTIGAEQLAENPLAELDLPEGATVIMAEWATGSYVDSWEKSFLAYGAQALSGSSVRVR
ncbi:hypothetical protein E4K67_16220 [Desulfosporosinus fructosivorans]|uniref:Lipoprotein n=1 Tax=Desulfosporosinus fructosivorans TaxID=2018669 RepID=A0A4Z0R3L5_9FIRM|nr:hypothetical protein [Desulfosporosinus fructosivorans]TGE37378.1 hypothetical protein E4K67_16220 [Desulfosporosinus fructosivorans]